jgi:iron complex outermembrane recepter protein
MARLQAPVVTRGAFAIVSSLMSLHCPELFAQPPSPTQLEEVVVTSQQREESLQQVPIAVTALNAGTLEEIGVTDIGGLTGYVPGLVVQPTVGGSVNAAISIRGSGLGVNNLSRDTSVGLYLNGVPIAKTSGAIFDGIDIARIEVLRGPQGTLYGKNSVAGAINIISARPTGKLGGYATAGVGNADLRSLRSTLDLPAVGEVGRGAGQLSTRISHIRRTRNGFFRNEMPGLQDYDNRDQWGLRLASLLQVSEQLSLEYAYDEFVLDQRPPMLTQYKGSRKRPNSVAADNAKRSDVAIKGHTLVLNYDFDSAFWPGDLAFKSITAYRQLETRSASDFDGTAADLFRFIVDNDFEQRSQEFRLVGATDSIDYVAGLFFYGEEWFTFNPRWLFQFGANNYNYDTRGADADSIAAYTQATWAPRAFDRKLKLSAGLRWTRDATDMWRLQQSLTSFLTQGPTSPNACVCVRDASGVPLTRSGAPALTAIPSGPIGPVDLVPLTHKGSWTKATPMLVASWHWSDDLMAYAKYSTGYKSGGINDVAETNETFLRGFGPETMHSWELGLKSRLLNQRMQLNAAAFYNDFDDIQVNTFVPTVIGISVNNASAARISGFELELLARPMAKLDLAFNYAYLHTQYDKYLDLDRNTGTLMDYADLRKFPYSPRHTANAGLIYSFDPLPLGILQARVDYSWLDDQFIGVIDDPTNRIHSYGLLNGRVTLSAHIESLQGELTLSVWGRNLTDKEYTTSGVNLQVFTVNQWGDPRSYGMELSYRF